jgi:hypothetical protein
MRVLVFQTSTSAQPKRWKMSQAGPGHPFAGAFLFAAAASVEMLSKPTFVVSRQVKKHDFIRVCPLRGHYLL